MTTLDNNIATIKLEEGNTLVIVWKGFAKGNDYRNVLVKALEIVQKEKAKNWVSDLSKAKVVSPEDINWLEKEFIPRGFESGIEKVAFVIPSDVFSKIYMEQVIRKLESIKQQNMENYKNRDVSHFETLEDAMKWFKS